MPITRDNHPSSSTALLSQRSNQRHLVDVRIRITTLKLEQDLGVVPSLLRGPSARRRQLLKPSSRVGRRCVTLCLVQASPDAVDVDALTPVAAAGVVVEIHPRREVVSRARHDARGVERVEDVVAGHRSGRVEGQRPALHLRIRVEAEAVSAAVEARRPGVDGAAVVKVAVDEDVGDDRLSRRSSR